MDGELPVHWALFGLAAHGWTEPVERVQRAAASAGATIIVPRPGQRMEPGAPPAGERWWPELSFRAAAQDPIVSTQLN